MEIEICQWSGKLRFASGHGNLDLPVVMEIWICQWQGGPVTQWVKHWPTDLADRVPSPLEAKSSQPQMELHYTQPFIFNLPSS